MIRSVAEAMRLASREHTPHWMLARNRAVVRGRTLIVNTTNGTKALLACQGAAGQTFPYGDARVAGACNDARACHPAVLLPSTNFASAR